MVIILFYVFKIITDHFVFSCSFFPLLISLFVFQNQLLWTKWLVFDSLGDMRHFLVANSILRLQFINTSNKDFFRLKVVILT